MQRHIKINQIVPLGFGVVFVLMSATTVFSQWAKNTLVESSSWVLHTYNVELALSSLEKDLLNTETGQRGFIFTGNESYLEPYTNGKKNFKKHIIALKALVKENPAQVVRVEKIERLAQEKLNELADTISLKRGGKEQELRALVLSGKGKNIMDSIRTGLAEITEVEELLLAERQKAAVQVQQTSTIINWSGLAATIVIGSFISYIIARIIMRQINQINQAASAIASSSTEIAATVEQQERTVSQQAASVNQTTTTMDELGVSFQQSAQQAEASAAGARQALFLAEEGSNSVQRTMEGMSTLKEKVGAIAEQIMHLSEQTNQIGSVSDLVGDLANQTNMLALNAAVEAARAGEHGKGFGVVAGEIRKLADQSKKSAEKINALVTDIQSAINSTVMVTDEGTKKVNEGIKLAQGTAETFTGVTDSINNVFLNSQQISLNAKQQAIAVQQVVNAMNAINFGAKESANGITQVKVSTHQLNEAAHKLKAVV